MKIFCQNEKVKYEYEIIESLEAGLVLDEDIYSPKAIFDGHMSLSGSFVRIVNGEAFLFGASVGNWMNLPMFKRQYPNGLPPLKLLLSKKEILKLKKEVDIKGFSIVPTKVYQNKGKKKMKMEIVLVRGKKLYDKRETIKQRDIERSL